MIILKFKEWLEKHSVSSKRVGDEIIFTHASGHTSILLPREGRQDSVLSPKSRCLRVFYDEYLGASIGNGQIIVGASITGGISISHNFRIPDLEEMADQSQALGMPVPENREVFIMEACWMFVYAVDQTPSGESFLRYDRDFQHTDVLSEVEPILDAWWQMIKAESIKCD